MQRRSFISLVSAALAAPALPALPAVAVANPASHAGKAAILIKAMFHPRAAYRFTPAEVAAKARISEAEASQVIQRLLDEGYIVGKGRLGAYANAAPLRAARRPHKTETQKPAPQSSTAETAPDTLWTYVRTMADTYFAARTARA